MLAGHRFRELNPGPSEHEAVVELRQDEQYTTVLKSVTSLSHSLKVAKRWIRCS
jgi:hypothetical protein